MHTSKEIVFAALEAAELDAMLKCDNQGAWDRVWQSLAYQCVTYSSSMLEYQHAYFLGAGWDLIDISLVLFTDGRPCGLWPLTLGGPIGSARLSSGGAAVLAPIFVPGLSPRTIKKICSRAIAFLRSLGSSQNFSEVLLEQGPEFDGLGEGVSEWHQQLVAAGAVAALRHDLYADLRPDLTDIRSSFRKSFRPLINVGLRNWFVFVLDRSNISAVVWAEFKQLHYDAAGRSTRSDETWATQYAMLNTDEAFLVGLRDPTDQRLVGAGFFQCTRDEGLYAVAAYDRALFEKPLGHVVQQRAIETMKSRGLRWYRIGERYYPQDKPSPTDKQVSISTFKQGFASHVFLRCEFVLPLLGAFLDSKV